MKAARVCPPGSPPSPETNDRSWGVELLPYAVRRSVIRVISDGTPVRSAEPGQRPVPLLT